jgi:hypothetical protein
MHRARDVFNRVLPKSDVGKSFVISVGIMGLAYVQMYGITTSSECQG